MKGYLTLGTSLTGQEVSLDRQVGDITVYKDNQGHDSYYLERTVGEYEVTLIGNDDDAMIKMLQSIELAD